MNLFCWLISILILFASLHLSWEKSALNDVSNASEFIQERNIFMSLEKRRQLGGNIRLNAKERVVNEILMTAKRSEIDQAFSTGEPFPPAIHFFRAKQLIDESTVFQIIRKMPKGADLHIHDTGLANLTWVVQNITYRDNPLFFCEDKDGVLSYQYFVKEAPPQNPDCPWKSVREERAKAANVEMFDAKIYNSLSLIVDNPEEIYPNGRAAWIIFAKILQNTISIFSLKSVFVDYFYRGLEEFLEDNIQLIEMRANLPEILDDNDGRKLSQTEVMQLYKDTADRFIRDNPEFFGVRIIFSGLRIFTNEEVLRDIKTSIRFMSQFPSFFVGYDLIFDEDRSRPLIDYVNELLFPRTLNPPVNLRYFFHAGETAWQGMRADKNLVDAVLLNTTRLGHGFTLTKHPLVRHIMRRCGIALETQPISHQVLTLIQDQRDHPAADLIASGFPVVIGSDTPPMWDSKPLSHDYYIAFMGFTGRDDDIRVLKKLAMNTLTFSSLSGAEKDFVFRLWNKKWDEFLDDIIATYEPQKRYIY